MRRLFVTALILGMLLIAALVLIPAAAQHYYGSPSRSLSSSQVFQYSAKLLWDDGLLTQPISRNDTELQFTVEQGETVNSIADRLQQAGAIRSAEALRDYLLYTGLDKSVQAGKYKLSTAMSAVDVAHAMQDATPEDVTVVVWPGWRMEEIAESLPTTGLDITPDEFVAAAGGSHPEYEYLAGKASAEGFLYPGTYVLPRTTGVYQLVNELLLSFSQHLSPELRDGFQQQGLSVYQAVTLASIVEREAVNEDEAPLIASVYLNRLRLPMKLDADPTVQYAIGYNPVQRTWWTNPLGAADTKIASPFNTYVNDGLPPAPISNPGPEALHAVADPADTDYYYFSARCDGSGFHQFARTFEEHLQHICP